MRFVLAEKINDYRPLNVPVTVVSVVTRHQKLVKEFMTSESLFFVGPMYYMYVITICLLSTST